MELKEAVQKAKNFATDVLGEEGLQNLGTEEIQYDDKEKVWDITLGFSRPWNSSRGTLSALTGETLQRRAYRIFRVRDSDGQVLSMKKQGEVD